MTREVTQRRHIFSKEVKVMKKIVQILEDFSARSFDEHPDNYLTGNRCDGGIITVIDWQEEVERPKELENWAGLNASV